MSTLALIVQGIFRKWFALSRSTYTSERYDTNCKKWNKYCERRWCWYFFSKYNIIMLCIIQYNLCLVIIWKCFSCSGSILVNTPVFAMRCNLPWCAILLLVPLCPVSIEGHDNYGKICVFEWIIVEWWINTHTPSEDWFAGNDTPESFNLKDSRASNGERVQFASKTVCKMASYLQWHANVS